MKGLHNQVTDIGIRKFDFYGQRQLFSLTQIFSFDLQEIV